ncbi:MAG TPA: uracil-DNA glycosylase [Pyrinomonadaceae bacterium]|nr:uracil-DNA glycosylase [Pyrinomonadaceae bacterium]
MSNESEVKELLSLAADAREYLSYMSELGVEALDVSVTEATPAQLSETHGKRETTEPTASQLAALERNAAAVERAASPDSIKSPALPESFAGASSSKRDETEMATRKKKFPDEVPPAPQETLFGEVTPQDVESLPRSDETLEDIWNDIGICMRCPLCCQGRTNIVNSEGNRKARLMFVGEAPGADEDASGRPFVGRAGQLLNKIIEAIGMSREDVFIGNVNRCRPPQNRTPTTQEAAICKPFLLREIAIVRPDVIVVLGNTAMKNLLDTKEGITKLRGKFQDYRGIKVMPTFHPAYLLRDPSKKREAWDDMKKVRDYLKGRSQNAE